MCSKAWPKGVPGTLHYYTEQLVAFEFCSKAQLKPHALIFLGGLGDGIASPAYLSEIVRALTDTEWTVLQPVLTSSYRGWGLSSLNQDIDEVAQLVAYVKQYRADSGRVVLMGHSTGSQDVLHYLYNKNPRTSGCIERPPIDGAILQAPVSDREAIQSIMNTGFSGRSSHEISDVYHKLNKLAQDLVSVGQAQTGILPLELTSQIYPNTAINAERWLSLASPNSPQAPGADDVFSSDLTDELLATTFGSIHERGLLRQKIMFIMSGSDGAVPPSIDKQALLNRWKDAIDGKSDKKAWHDDSGIIEGANHAVDEPHMEAQRYDLVQRVKSFLEIVASN